MAYRRTGGWYHALCELRPVACCYLRSQPHRVVELAQDADRYFHNHSGERRNAAETAACACPCSSSLDLGPADDEERDRDVLASHSDDGQRVEELVIAEDGRRRIWSPLRVHHRTSGIGESSGD